MKKLIFSLFILCLFATTAFAFERYTGMPQLPYIIYGTIEKGGVPVSGAVLSIKNVNTGYLEQLRTTGDGIYQTDGQNWLSISAGRPPVMYGDVIEIKITDGCGTGDVCTKTFSAYTGTKSSEYKDYAVVDFSVTGTVTCPACPSCSSGGGCYINEVTAEKCAEEFPCSETSCPVVPECNSVDCPPEKICPPPIVQNCDDIVCDECLDKEDHSLLAGLIGAILLIIGGGFKIYKNRAGGITMLHRHRGIIAYHDPDTQHKNAEIRHAKFSENPKQYLADMKKINEGISL